MPDDDNMATQTKQEIFWLGEFGEQYLERNVGLDRVSASAAMFANIIKHTSGIDSILELGANRGLNLQALRTIVPKAKLTGLEINKRAYEKLSALEGTEAVLGSLLNFQSDLRWSLTFTRGVLIHINPDRLPDAYNCLYSHSRRYVMVAEYYNPTPVSILYRGHADRLYKRDFAGEMLDQFPDLTLVSYGFCYHRDSNFPQDDITWFLMEKAGQESQ